EVMCGRPCYEVAFSDGSTIVADAEHQWVADGTVHTTERLAAMLAAAPDRAPALPQVAAVDLPDQSLPLHPYALGAWLGNPRDFVFARMEPEIVCQLE